MKPDRHTIETAGDYSSFAINESILRSELFVAHRWMNLYRLRVYRERFPTLFQRFKAFPPFSEHNWKIPPESLRRKRISVVYLSALVQSNPFKLGLQVI